MARQLENNFRVKLSKFLKATYAEKIYIQKFHGGFYQAGLPDTAFVFDNNTSWIEMKADETRQFEADNITALQRFTLRNIALAGGKAGVWHWIAARKVVQCFTYDVLVRMSWGAESRFYSYENLTKDVTVLKQALWHP